MGCARRHSPTRLKMGRRPAGQPSRTAELGVHGARAAAARGGVRAGPRIFFYDKSDEAMSEVRASQIEVHAHACC